MDNFRFDMTCEGDGALDGAIMVIWKARHCEGEGPRGQKWGATHYAIRPAEPAIKDAEKPYLDKSAKPLRLVFFNYVSTPRDHIALPFRLDAKGAADFARRWLAEADYGKEPDHDGDNGKGWRLYCEGCGHIDSEHGAIIAVTPAWAMYGK